MAKLVQLHISGIRNFAPSPGEVISQQLKFESPLTVILGPNGSGKTTIMEAISYICSGEVFGAKRDLQDFVHDPKLSNNCDLDLSTEGKIQLRIVDPQGNNVTVMKKVMVCTSKQSLLFKFKSKPSIITKVGPDGEITTSCDDNTNKFCKIMNVSPAILNNVILCHQENSTWPFSESQKLKEKFDEIFEVEKYNNCIRAFKKQLKQKEQEIGLLKEQLAAIYNKRENVKRHEENLKEKENKLQTLQDEIDAKTMQLKHVKNQLDEILRFSKNLENFEKQLIHKEVAHGRIVEEETSISMNILVEFKGNDEELENNIKSLEEDRHEDENLITKLEKTKNGINDNLGDLTKVMGEAQNELEKLKQEMGNYLMKSTERELLINQIKGNLGIDVSIDYKNPENIKTALEKMKMFVESSFIGLTCLIEEKEIEENGLQLAIDEIHDNVVRTKNSIEIKENQLTECQKKVEKISSMLQNLKIFDVDLRNYEKEIKNIDEKIQNLTSTFNEAQEFQILENFKRNIEHMEQSRKTLVAEYKKIEHNNVIEKEIEKENCSIKEKMENFEITKKIYFDNLLILFQEIPDNLIILFREFPENLKNKVLEKQLQTDVTVKKLLEEINEKQKDRSTIEELRHKEIDRIRNCEKEIKLKNQMMFEICNGKNFQETLENSTQKKIRLQRDKGHYISMKTIFEEYIKKFEEKSPCCPVCETDFSMKNNIVQKVIAKLKIKLKEIPHKLVVVEHDLEKEEAFCNKLEQLKLVNSETETLKNVTLPRSWQEFNELDRNLNTNKADLEVLQIQLKTHEKTAEVCKNVIANIAILHQSHSEMEKSQTILKNLKLRLVPVDPSKSENNIRSEIELAKYIIAESRKQIDIQFEKINKHKNRLLQLEQDRRSYVDEQMHLKEETQFRQSQETERTKTNGTINKLKDEILESKLNLIFLEAELESAARRKEKIIRENKEQIEEERKNIESNKELMQNIDLLQSEIDKYLNNELDQKLSSTEDKINDYKQQENDLEQTQTKLIQIISELRNQLSTKELQFRDLENNAILREKRRHASELNSEIEILKNAIGDCNGKTTFSNSDRKILDDQREELEKEVDVLVKEKTGIMESIEELSKKLKKTKNKQVQTQYMSKYYEMKLTEKVIHDLTRYINALKQALLEFHEAKLTQINKILRQLWRDIYRGNDVDYIQIKWAFSDCDMKKQCYTYKIMQIKNGVELNMRKRCSTSQKILASLLIRMALAQTFKSNCGILALDEPTAHLDQENKLSLCEALSRFISSAQKENNFQLLVITHDEEFANALTNVQGVSHYYKITRDNEGFSVINKQIL